MLAPWIYLSDMQLKRCHILSFFECPICIWWNGLSVDEVPGLIDYMVSKYAASTQLKFKTMEFFIQQTPVGKLVYWSDLADKVWRLDFVNGAEECGSYEVVFLPKFSRPRKMMLDTSPQTISRAKACLLLDKHRRFIGCERYGSGVRMSMTGLVEVKSC